MARTRYEIASTQPTRRQWFCNFALLCLEQIRRHPDPWEIEGTRMGPYWIQEWVIGGLRALEHLGLVELEQSGRRTDRACLCHCAPATRAIAGAPAKLAGARRHKGAHRRVG
jgi:hypothetical protein